MGGRRGTNHSAQFRVTLGWAAQLQRLLPTFVFRLVAAIRITRHMNSPCCQLNLKRTIDVVERSTDVGDCKHQGRFEDVLIWSNWYNPSSLFLTNWSRSPGRDVAIRDPLIVPTALSSIIGIPFDECRPTVQPNRSTLSTGRSRLRKNLW